MAEYSFILQHSPSPVDIPPFCQPGFFFNEHPHLQQQNGGDFYLLSALNRQTQQAEARCAFFLTDIDAVSPLAAPFGSIELAEKLPASILSAFINAFIESLRQLGSKKIRIVNYPNCYALPQAERLASALDDHNFELVEAHQNSFLSVDQANRNHHLIPAERRRLHKCWKAGFQFMHWKAPNLTEVIDFIRETHQRKGYRLTIQSNRLTDLMVEFPDRFAVFLVRDNRRLAAITVAVRVRDDILYNFLPASDPTYDTYSPMVMLINGLYDYCQQQKIHLLDLGVSLDANRQPKQSLLRFKRNLGAQESLKCTFEKVL